MGAERRPERFQESWDVIEKTEQGLQYLPRGSISPHTSVFLQEWTGLHQLLNYLETWLKFSIWGPLSESEAVVGGAWETFIFN